MRASSLDFVSVENQMSSDTNSDLEQCGHGAVAPQATLLSLHRSQAMPGVARHKCANCAYAAGLKAGQDGTRWSDAAIDKCQTGATAPSAVLTALPRSQAGSGRHRCVVCAFYEGYLEAIGLSSSVETEAVTHGGELDAFIPDAEGRRLLGLHVRYERSKRNRVRAIALHGTRCKACGFDFNRVYGRELARDYIEIHHARSITELEGIAIDLAQDLVPLCSNCHSMAHRERGRILTLEELQELLAHQRGTEGRGGDANDA